MVSLSLAIIQHHQAEGPGRISDWCKLSGHKITRFMAPDGCLPDLNQFDGIIILGGPMDVEDNPRWMQKERSLIHSAIEINKPLIGICLGSQLLASVLGAKIYPLKQAELGWYDLRVNANVCSASLANKNLINLAVPQWHYFGFNFDSHLAPLTHKSVEIKAYSSLCPQQVFRHQQQYGIQFHPEWDAVQLAYLQQAFSEQCPEDLYAKSRMNEQTQLQHWFFNLLDTVFRSAITSDD